MLLNRIYYQLKPAIPPPLRIALRGIWAKRRRKRFEGVWPINPDASKAPPAWPGWPDGKQFALVLTHDVESAPGLRRCRQLMELEMSLGFRSSFNFVPEGDYTVPKELRDCLTGNGFEVGVHDLQHDGKLYWSHTAFKSKAKSINQYLKEWRAVGFRSGFMLRRLDWLHELDTLYDASTFDTDPFEPQPDGVGTIFPFWVPHENGRGYAELPYTLVQDSTLFLLLREPNIRIWKEKLDWIVKHGGMALLNVHPDYINFDNGNGSFGQYPVAHYRDLLEFVRSNYKDQYWHALPKDIAGLVSRHRSVLTPPKTVSAPLRRPKVQRSKIWIDLDNTPHVPFFKPIIRELQNRGHEVLLTARDAFQVWPLVQQAGLPCKRVGRHCGRNPFLKLAGLLIRAAQLIPIILRERPDLALSLGARSQMLLANAFGIPTVEVNDYEHAKWAPLARPTWLLAPAAIAAESFGPLSDRVLHYSGLKEDVYAPEFRPNPAIRAELGLKENEIVITVRPPADEAHYHNPDGDRLFVALMSRLTNLDRAKIVLLPRNRRQELSIRNRWPDWFANGKTIVPPTAVDGLNLIYFSDLVVSGGGTMNREAAALGVPVYSIFRGRMGSVDRRLAEQGRLIMIENETEVQSRILIQARDKGRSRSRGMAPRPALLQIVNHIEQILLSPARSRSR